MPNPKSSGTKSQILTVKSQMLETQTAVKSSNDYWSIFEIHRYQSVWKQSTVYEIV